MSQHWQPVTTGIEGLPSGIFTGGWVGFTGYDTVRYVYQSKIPFDQAPPDTTGFNDLHLGLFHDVVVFDQATKLSYVVCWVALDDAQKDDNANTNTPRVHPTPTPYDDAVLEAAYEAGSDDSRD